MMNEQTERRKPGSPLSSLERIRQELDRWIETAWTQGERTLDAFGIRHPTQGWMPDIDVTESAEEVTVFVDLPGVQADAVQLSLAGNMLNIKGEIPATSVEEPDVAHMRERRTGTFRRFVAMPAPVDPDRVSAMAKDGVLKVVLAKTEVAKPRQIHVKGVDETATDQPPAGESAF